MWNFVKVAQLGQDNYPKHILKWIKQTNMVKMVYQSPDLISFEGLLTTLKGWICTRDLINVNQFYKFCQEEWSNIQLQKTNDKVLSAEYTKKT